MRLSLTGRHLDVSPTLRQLIERKLKKIDRLLNDSVVSAQVVLSRQKHRHVVEITVHARGDHMLRAIGSAPDWPASVKTAVEKIGQQSHKLKDRWETRKRRAAPRRSLAGEPPVPSPGERSAGRRDDTPRILRASRYVVKPMAIEDAALAVEGGRETFLVFRNATTDEVNILYRRKDGHLGLIEPDR